MNFSGYILAEIEDINNNTIIVPMAPTETVYYVTHNGNYTIDDVIGEVEPEKSDWLKTLFGMYIYNPTFKILNEDDKIIDIVVGSKYVKVFADVYFEAFNENKNTFDSYQNEDMIDLEFETKLSLYVDIPNISYSASRLFTHGDIHKEVSDYYNYILYIGRLYSLDYTGVCEPTDLFKVGSTSKSFNERYREFHKGDSSLRKIERVIRNVTHIKCIESYVIPPFIDTEATISSITCDTMKDQSLDKRIIKDLFDGSRIKLRLDHIIYDSYYLAMCKLFHHKTMTFNNHNEKRSILDVNSRGTLTKISEKYITFISNIMIKDMDKKRDTRRYSPIFNYIISQMKSIKLYDVKSDEKTDKKDIGVNLDVNNTNTQTNRRMTIKKSTFNSPFNNIDNSINVHQHIHKGVDEEERADIKMKNFIIKLVFVIDLLLTSSTSFKKIPMEVVDRFAKLYCEINKSRQQELLVKDKIIESLNNYYIEVK
jgi:hypothetical protein